MVSQSTCALSNRRDCRRRIGRGVGCADDQPYQYQTGWLDERNADGRGDRTDMGRPRTQRQQKDLYADDFDYVIMTNRIVENREQNTLDNVKTCFQKFEGQDIISVKRNGLMLSTLRKKL